MNLPVKRVENRTGDQKYWLYGVGNNKTRTPSNIVLLQGQATMIPTFPYGVDRRKISTFLAGVIPDKFAVRF